MLGCIRVRNWEMGRIVEVLPGRVQSRVFYPTTIRGSDEDPNSTDAEGRTPLHATMEGMDSIVHTKLFGRGQGGCENLYLRHQSIKFKLRITITYHTCDTHHLSCDFQQK